MRWHCPPRPRLGSRSGLASPPHAGRMRIDGGLPWQALQWLAVMNQWNQQPDRMPSTVRCCTVSAGNAITAGLHENRFPVSGWPFLLGAILRSRTAPAGPVASTPGIGRASPTFHIRQRQRCGSCGINSQWWQRWRQAVCSHPYWPSAPWSIAASRLLRPLAVGEVRVTLA